MYDFDTLKEQWQIATAKLPWGVQRVFRDVFVLASEQKTPTPLVWGRDYGDGGACLVNQGAQFLNLINGEGGQGKPMAAFNEVVSLFDRINAAFLEADVNVDKTVSPLAADIFVQWFAPLRPRPVENAASEAVAPEAFASGIISERSDEDLARALMDMLTEPPAAIESNSPVAGECNLGCQPDWHKDDCAIYWKNNSPVGNPFEAFNGDA